MTVTTRKSSRALLASTSALALALGGALVVSSPATAASFTASDETELAAAITAANVAADLDTITLTDNILLTADLPSITESLEIIGDGYSIDGGGYDVFYDDDATSIASLTFTGVSVMNTEAAVVTSYSINVTITDSVFDDAPVDLYGDGGNTIVVRDSDFHDASGDHGLQVSARDGSEVTVTGSSANGNNRNGFYIFVVINSTLNLSDSSADGNSRNGFQVTAEVDSTATITDVTAAGNVISGLLAVLELGATTSVSDSTFSGTTDGFGVVLNPTNDSTVMLTRVRAAGNDGGGIHINDGGYVGDHSTVTITDSTIDGNDDAGVSIVNSDVDPYGAGATSLEIAVRGSTISNNSAPGAGGIDAILHGDSSLSIHNSTISGNEQRARAAVTISPTSESTATVSISHTTIVDNYSTPHHRLSAGGLHVAKVQLVISHSVLAGNVAKTVPSDLSFDVSDLPTSDIGYSLVQISEYDALAAVDAGTGNLKNMGAQLGALTDNGGPTLTHLPLDGSPVINAGNSAIAGTPATDQRGQTRIVGTIDLGAIEVQPALAATGADTVVPIAGGALALGLGILLLLARRRILLR